jgi:hypothetical protein
MTDLEKLVLRGILKDNEEIYLHYRNEIYNGRIIEEGKKIQTDLGIFDSLSLAASPLMGSNENCQRKFNEKKFYNNNGWEWWRNWKGIKLQEIRKKLND